MDNTRAEKHTVDAKAGLDRLRGELLAEMQEEHLSTSEMIDCIDGHMDRQDTDALRQHVDRCSTCKDEFDRLMNICGTLDALGDATPASPPADLRFQTVKSTWRTTAWFAIAASLALLGFLLNSTYISWRMRTEIVALKQDNTRLQTKLSQAIPIEQTSPLRQRLADQQARLAQQQRTIAEQEGVLRSAESRTRDLQVRVAALQKTANDQRRLLVRLDRSGVGPDVPVRNNSDRIARAAPIPPKESALERDVRIARAERRLPLMGTVDGLIVPGGIRMGASTPNDGHFVPVSPVGTNVLTERPSFRWRSLPEAETYEVILSDDGGHLYRGSGVLKPVQNVAVQEWTPPQALPRGVVLHWYVKAVRRDGSTVTAPQRMAPGALFMILSHPRADYITGLARTAQGSPQTLAVLYAKYGLLDEAEREIRVLRAANPTSGLPRRWLAGLEAYRKR